VTRDIASIAVGRFSGGFYATKRFLSNSREIAGYAFTLS
jgi:hypothetical protein